MSYEVLFSPDINQSDVVSYNGKNSIFELNKTNDSDDDLIILYMYVLPKFPTHGIKVGMATCHKGETFSHALKKRVGEQVHELALTNDQFAKYGNEREVIYWGVCLDARNEKFKDYHVHSEILKTNAGLTEKDQEWFTNVPQDELIEIFDKVRNTGSKKEIFTPREEQQECIDALKAYFENKPKGGRFLLNCKMRFGKSFTTYKYCEEENLNKILILTFIPAVESSWRDDLLHIKKDYKYLTDKNLRDPFFHLRAVDSPYVLFLSLQNFLGKDKDGEVKEKIAKLQDELFDLVILDEYHFGAWNERTQEKLEDLTTYLHYELSKLPIEIYTKTENTNGVFAFNIPNVDSQEVANYLNEKWTICVRSGFHCAPLKHKALGTLSQGAVRVSMYYFNTYQEIERLVLAIKTLLKHKRVEKIL